MDFGPNRAPVAAHERSLYGVSGPRSDGLHCAAAKAAPARGAAAEAQPRVRSPAHAERLREEAFHTFFGAWPASVFVVLLFVCLFFVFCLLLFVV